MPVNLYLLTFAIFCDIKSTEMKNSLSFFLLFVLMLISQVGTAQSDLTALEKSAEVAIKQEAVAKKAYDKQQKKFKAAKQKLENAQKKAKKYKENNAKESARAISARTSGLDTGNADDLKKAEKLEAKAEKLEKKADKLAKSANKLDRKFDNEKSKLERLKKDWEKADKSKEEAMKAREKAIKKTSAIQ